MERKQNHNLIPIIIFVFEMFINSLSKSVVLLLYSGRSVRARIFNLCMLLPELSAMTVIRVLDDVSNLPSLTGDQNISGRITYNKMFKT